MAIYRLETKIIRRQQKGKSAVAAAAYQSGMLLSKAAYRSGTELEDQGAKQTFNYRPRRQEVAHCEILAPKDGPIWLQAGPPQGREDAARQRAMRERLWNTIEQVEKRKDSQLARDFIASIPRELTLEQQIGLIRGWCKEEFVNKGYVADFAIHRSKDGLNPHAHILVTMRPVDGQGFGKKPSNAGKFNGRGAVGLAAKADLVAWRESYARHANTALESAGRPERVDHRSLKDQGVDREPEPKMGPAATAMKRRGLDSERFRLWRYVKTLNVMKPLARAVGKFQELRQEGMGKTWWERSLIFMSQAREVARESVVDTWRAMLERPPRSYGAAPPTRSGPDLER
jgi:hypothetical protein